MAISLTLTESSPAQRRARDELSLTVGAHAAAAMGPSQPGSPAVTVSIFKLAGGPGQLRPGPAAPARDYGDRDRGQLSPASQSWAYYYDPPSESP